MSTPFFRDIRQVMESYDLDGLDLGPDEHELQMPDSELISAQQKEINRLRQDLHQTSNELETVELRVCMPVEVLYVYMYSVYLPFFKFYF